MQRRQFVRLGSGFSAAGLGGLAAWLPGAAAAQNTPGWNKAAFESHSLAEVVKSLGGSGASERSEVSLDAPEIAENGAVVRLSAQSSLPGTTQLALVVLKNPNALAAVFDIPPGTDAQVTTNLKMAQSSSVYALARVGNQFFYAVKDVKVTLGGCGN
jgi:sulfur-oxidizing protein SoxY